MARGRFAALRDTVSRAVRIGTAAGLDAGAGAAAGAGGGDAGIDACAGADPGAGSIRGGGVATLAAAVFSVTTAGAATRRAPNSPINPTASTMAESPPISAKARFPNLDIPDVDELELLDIEHPAATGRTRCESTLAHRVCSFGR
jgi:hypothetical protein